jgi:hypothetical protein
VPSLRTAEIAIALDRGLATLEISTGGAVAVEIFPRANGHTLITAFYPAAVTPHQRQVDRLQTIGERTQDGLIEGAYVATGQRVGNPQRASDG